MGLFTSPVTLNDGAADHVFTFKAQTSDKNSIVGNYIELADVANESELVVKQDQSKDVHRSLVSRKRNYTVGDVVYPITVNTTVTAHKAVPVAEIQKDVSITEEAATQANFVSYLRAGMV